MVLSYVVENLREVMERLRSAGIELERIKEHAYGRSAWIRESDFTPRIRNRMFYHTLAYGMGHEPIVRSHKQE